MVLRLIPWLLLTVALLGAGPSAAAWGQYQKRLSDLKPDDAKAAAELADWCQKAGLKGEAEALYRRVLAKEPDHANARKALGFQKVAGEWLDAEGRKRRELLLEAEGTQQPRLKLAEKAREAGFPDLEKRFLEEIVAKDPDHAGARRLLGQTRFEGEWKPDLELLAEYVGSGSEPHRKALEGSGWTAERLERHRRWAQQPKGEQRHLPLEGKGYKTEYVLNVPEAYTGLELLPLAVYLHGGGGGEVTEPEEVSGGAKFAPHWITAFPKCPNQPKVGAWNFPEGEASVLDLVDRLSEQYAVDPTRIYLTGSSMGGWGTLHIGARHPGRFAALGAACPVSGGADAKGLAKTPLFLVHGEKDTTCDPGATRALDSEIARLGGVHQYVEIPGAGHVMPDEAHQKMFDWIGRFRRPAPDKASERMPEPREPPPKGKQGPLSLEGKGYRTEYLLQVPGDHAGPAPLLVFLHGGGANSVQEPETVYACFQLAPQDWICAFPKCPNQPKMGAWNSPEAEASVLDLVRRVSERYAVDRARIYLAGLSMGGWGTLTIAARHPELFAAAGAGCPDCSGADAKGLSRLPVYLLHGDQDDRCDPKLTRALDQALTRLKGVHKYVELPGVGHEIPDEAYQAMFAWMSELPEPRDVPGR